MDFPKKTEIEQLLFYNQCYKKYREASAEVGEVKHYFEIAGTRVCLLFAGDQLVPYMTPALEHLRIAETENPDVTFCIWDSESTKVKMVPPPCEWACFTDRGDIWGFNSKRIKTAFHWGEYSVNVMDLETNTGIYWVETSSALPYWIKSSPLRTLLHWWMEKNEKQLLHAASIGTDDGAVLITGRGGAGKSTTSLICLQSGLYYLSDDYLIVALKPEPAVYSLYSTAKLRMEETDKLPFFKKFIKEPENSRQEKAVLYLYPELKDQIRHKMPLKAIFTPVITNKKESRITSIPFWTIQGAVSFTTMSQLPNVGRNTHDFIIEMCKSLPSYTLELGNDFENIALTISSFLSNSADFTGIEQTVPKDKDAVSTKPLVSIIIPVYNGEEFIEEAIENILSQNYPAIEIIIVNDGSTDNSENIIKNLPIDIRYFYQQNDGPASARNRGIKDASGEFIAFLDVDDFWRENNLILLVDELLSNPELMGVKGHAQLLGKNEQTGSWDFIGNPKESFPGYIGSALYRKKIFDEVGLFDYKLKFGEDSDWYFRAKEMNINMKYIDEVTLYVRRHEKNMTQGKNLVELNALKVFKKSLDRKRTRLLENKDQKSENISVIIPVFNCASYLAEALESVLDQQLKPAEIIVIDDGSTDNSAKIARMYKPDVILLQQENKGAAAARNLGISKAKGSCLAFLDADDLWMPAHLSLLFHELINEPELDIVFGSIEQFISPELDEEHRRNLRDELKNMPGYSIGSMLIWKDSFLKVGLLNVQLQLAEFIDWFSRANDKKLKSKMLPDKVLRRRIHITNQGLVKRDHLKDYTSVLREALARKRKMNNE